MNLFSKKYTPAFPFRRCPRHDKWSRAFDKPRRCVRHGVYMDLLDVRTFVVLYFEYYNRHNQHLIPRYRRVIFCKSLIPHQFPLIPNKFTLLPVTETTLSYFCYFSRSPSSSLANMAYNQSVEAFRDEEYPMMKGQLPSSWFIDNCK